MKILSHRGYWQTASEKNTESAFIRSFSLGFGTETDVRELNGELVISHDIPTGCEIKLSHFLKLANTYDYDGQLTLALNIKCDGIASLIERSIQPYKKLDCFVFDMSIPEMRSYFREGIDTFARMSEVERYPAWMDKCKGIWLDSFDSDWFTNSNILDLLRHNKRVCVVSPELHKRNHLDCWKRIKPIANEPLLMLCTDFPERAQEFFKDSKY